MTIISDLGTLILKLRAQLSASPWQHDPSTVNVAHPAHDIMRNTHYVFKETLPFSSQVRYFGKWHFSRGILRSQYLGLENVLGVTGVCWILSVAELRTGFFVVVVVVFVFFFRSVRSRFPRFRQSPCFLSEFSLAPCNSFLVSDWTLWCFLCWFHNTLEKSIIINASQRWVRTTAQKRCIRRALLSE